MEITLNLTAAETQDILNTLGDLPTKYGAYPLMVKIKQQAEACLNAPPATETEGATA